MTLTPKQLGSVLAAIAALGGGIEMRVAVGRLETSVAQVEKRVERIERGVDADRHLASRDE